MIGTQIRGFHHLSRVVGNTPKIFIFKRDNGRICMAEAVAIKGDDVPSRDGGESIYFFNNAYGRSKPSLDRYHGKEIFNTLSALNDRWSGAIKIYISKDVSSMNDYSSYIRAMWMMPDSFYNDYERFCNENKKRFNVVERKYVNKNEPLLKYIYALCNGSNNYFFWAVAQYFGNDVPLCDIKRVIDWANNYGQLAKDLKKGTVTGYTNSEQLKCLLNETLNLRKQKRIRDVINSFNTAQKKILKSRTLSNRDKDTLAKFGKLSPTKKTNFIRKMSTIEDGDEIMKQMAYVVNIHFEWNKDSLIDYITHTENLHAEIVSSNGDIVLVKVNDYDAVKYLGKSTNWCISKNKTYWNQYTRDDGLATQYIIFDFSKPEDDVLSIIGFTSVFNRGITHAHDFVNHNLMTDRPRRNNVSIKSFLDKFNRANGIFSILENDKIKLCDVTSYDKTPYEWNKESFIKYLNECVDENNYDIVHDSDNKLAVIVNDQNVRYFLGDNYMNNTNRDIWRRQHIIFADFSLPQNDPDKLIFGIVSQNDETYESYVNCMYNEHFDNAGCSFDAKLAEYDLPYDIICRTDDVVNRYRNALMDIEVPIIRQLLENKDLVKAIQRGEGIGVSCDTYYQALYTSILNYHSFELLEAFYNKGFTLTELMGEDNVNNLFYSIYDVMYNVKQERDGDMTLPTNKELSKFEQGTLDSYDETLYVGMFQALNMLIEHERNGYMFRNFCLYLSNHDEKSSLIDYLVTKASGFADYKNPSDSTYYMIKYAVRYQLKDALANIDKHSNPQIREWIQNIERDCGINHEYYSAIYSF